jgi:type I restriction enzyme S subunit
MWPVARLPDVAEIIMGQSPPGDTYNETSDGLPFFQGKAEFGEVSPTPKKWCNSPKKIAETGDILMSVRAPVGPTNLANTQCCIGRGLAAIRAKEEVLDPGYLRFALRQAEPKLASMGQGSTFAAIGRAELATTSFLLPPLPEQRRIVDLLSRAEGIVRLRREAEKKAAELIPALFLNLFGDPATNPKGWPVDKLDAVAKIISGATKGRRFDPSEAIELPYMRVANVKDGHLDLTEIKTIAVKRGEVEKYRLQPGDLLMTEGGDPDKLGRGALWSGEIETCLHQNHIFKVRADRSRLLPEYLCELVGSRYGKAYFLRVAKKTTGIATINRTQLGGFPIVVPPLSRQTEFVEKFSAVRSIQSQQSAATAKALATFDALLARCFSPDLAGGY